MERSEFAAQLMRLGAGQQSRRAVLGRLGLRSVPAGVLAASCDVDPAWFAALPKRGNVGIAPPVGEE